MSTDTDAAITSMIEDEELLVVSNRQPYSHEYDENGDIVVNRPTGGLTAGLDPVVQRTDGTWVAWGDGEADPEVTGEDDTIRMPPETEAYTLRRVWLTDEEVDGYYYGYSNQVLWPLCHGGIWKADFEDEEWEQYHAVNERFADAVVEEASDSSLIWFQDYHFGLAPKFVRERLGDPFLMQFWHIPWPGWETFRSCPQAGTILAGLLANDLMGFHTTRYCDTFLRCADSALDGAFVDYEQHRVQYKGHITYVRPFPLGIDAKARSEASEKMGADFWRDFRAEYGIPEGTRLALGVDRLDYTKGIPERLDALETLFANYPEWRGELTLFQKGSESRSLIDEYQDLQETVNESVERINVRFGTEEWQPVIYTNDRLEEDTLSGLYRHADVALVSAVRDGMNLVAKEFVAAQVGDPGVLVLSNQTGAYEQLGEHSLTIHPYDTSAFADTIVEALELDADERRERMDALREEVMTNDLDAWMENVFGTAMALKNERRNDRGEH